MDETLSLEVSIVGGATEVLIIIGAKEGARVAQTAILSDPREPGGD